LGARPHYAAFELFHLHHVLRGITAHGDTFDAELAKSHRPELRVAVSINVYQGDPGYSFLGGRSMGEYSSS